MRCVVFVGREGLGMMMMELDEMRVMVMLYVCTSISIGERG